MLENLIEIYLSSIKEVQFFLPFKAVLEAQNYFDVFIVHGKNELGRDLIAKKSINDKIVQFSFQLKAGNISLNGFRKDARPQLFEASTSTFPHPNYDNKLEQRVVFVTTGKVTENVILSLNELNNQLSNKSFSNIHIWDKSKLINYLISSGIETFFSVHGGLKNFNEFYQFYNLIIQNESIDFIYIEKFSRRWSERDWNNNQLRLQTFFEAYFLSKIANESNLLYEAVLINSALIRCLIKNEDFENLEFSILYFYELTEKIVLDYEKNISDKDYLLKHATQSSLLNLFSYPIICYRIVEVLSLQILIFSKEHSNLIDKSVQLFLNLVRNEPGISRPISDNYSITVLFISLTLIKLNEINLLKKFINNTTVWICDRYEDLGLAYLGTSINEELEQLISEHLEGFNHNTKNTSFLVSTILYISTWIGDVDFFKSISNEFQATEIIAQYYHILDNKSLFSYDSDTIIDSHDHRFSLILSDDFSNSSSYEKNNTTVTIPHIGFLFVMQLMRDRIFPFQIREYILSQN